MSVLLGIISLVSLILGIYLSYKKGGDVPNGYGVAGLLACVFSFVGLLLGIVTVKDKAYYRFFPWAGVILNVMSLGCISMILYLGSML